MNRELKPNWLQKVILKARTMLAPQIQSTPDTLELIHTNLMVPNRRYTVEELIAFELDIANAFDAAQIRAPIHLANGNEQVLIDIFDGITNEDWVFVTWRSHIHCLLKGTPPDQLKNDILAGHSITLNYAEQRIVSSAIVGGILPIATGLAWSIKRNHGRNKVWVFIGDMAERTGIFTECRRYAAGHELPINFIVENNEKSVDTPTREVWGLSKKSANVTHYRYELCFPHSGSGKGRVNF